MQAESSQPNGSETLEIQEKLKNKDIALLNCGLGAKDGAGAYGRILLGMKTGVIRRYLALKWVNKEGAKQIELGALAEYIKYHKAQTNLITVHDVWGGGPKDDYLCYSMDLADDARLGRAVETEEEIATYKPDNLYTRMHDGDVKRVLPLKEINQYVMDLLDGLGHLEKLGLVHRDIKPENVLFLSGNAVLGDLGCMVKQDTEVWCGAGTWSYMSAEQRAKGEMGECHCYEDLYQLGEVIYRMCLNFEVKEHMNYCYMASSREKGQVLPPMKPPLMEVPGVLTAYEAKLLNAFVTLHACAIRPENRFHSVAEFRDAWNELLENARDPERQARLRRQKKLRQIFLIANGVFLVLILALAAGIIALKRMAPLSPTKPPLANADLSCSIADVFGRPWEREFIHGDEWYDPLQDLLDEEWVVSSPDRRARLPLNPPRKGEARELNVFWEGRELPEECEVRFDLTMFKGARECTLVVSLEPVTQAADETVQSAVFECRVTPDGFFEQGGYYDDKAPQTTDDAMLAEFQINLLVQSNQIDGQVMQQVMFATPNLDKVAEIPYHGPLRLRIRVSSRSDGEIMLSALRLFKPSEAPVTEDDWLALAQDTMSLGATVPEDSTPPNGQ